MQFWERLLFCCCFLSAFVTQSSAQLNYEKGDTVLLYSLLSKNSFFQNYVAQRDEYRIQIIYTKVKHDKGGHVSFENHSFNLKDTMYFYPASLVKLPLSIFALEQLNSLHSKGVSMDTRIRIERNYGCQTAVKTDPFSDNLQPTFRNYITKALVISDNESYNRLYEFVGQDYSHLRLSELGYKQARIITRFAPCSWEENKHINGIRFLDNKNRLLFYRKPETAKYAPLPPLPHMKVGAGFTSGGEVVNQPKDFSKMNCLLLKDIHDMLVRLIYPLSNPKTFNINAGERNFLLECLSTTPSECKIKKVALNKDFFDAYTNYLYYGNEEGAIMNKNLKIYNIVGQSYGFLSDVAYFKDSTNGVEFFLSAVIYANQSNVLGGGNYDYKTVGFPFLKNLGQTMYQYELEKSRIGYKR
jgi:Beta-lactamase enzyme family